MRAFVITGPGKAEVQPVDPPRARPGEVIVDVERAGVCGTDLEFFSGEMAYLHSGEAAYPMRIGHEWTGVVTAVGAAADEQWLGRRVTGDTMLGCGHCTRCLSGRQHLCASRYEIGVRNGWPGALAEQLPVPVRALHELPDSVDATLGALVEPGANALRAVQAAGLVRPGQPLTAGVPRRASASSAGRPGPGAASAPDRGHGSSAGRAGPDTDGGGARVLIMGPGTIGLLAAKFAVAAGAEVHLLGLSLGFARSVGFADAWTADELLDLAFDVVIDSSTAASLPATAVDLVEPGGRVVFIGIAEEPSLVDTRRLALKDVTAAGVLSGSGALADTIEAYASGAVDPRPLVAATVGLDDAVAVLSGRRDPAWGDAPKVHIDPRI